MELKASVKTLQLEFLTSLLKILSLHCVCINLTYPSAWLSINHWKIVYFQFLFFLTNFFSFLSGLLLFPLQLFFSLFYFPTSSFKLTFWKFNLFKKKNKKILSKAIFSSCLGFKESVSDFFSPLPKSNYVFCLFFLILEFPQYEAWPSLKVES